MKKLLCAFLFVIVLLGCSSTKEYEMTLNGWINSNASDLIKGWGTPTDVEKLQNGKTLYLWTVHHSESMPMNSGTYSFNKTCDTSFLVNEKGIVESWHFEGDGCGN